MQRRKATDAMLTPRLTQEKRLCCGSLLRHHITPHCPPLDCRDIWHPTARTANASGLVMRSSSSCGIANGLGRRSINAPVRKFKGGHSKLPSQAHVAWTCTSRWDRVEITDILRGKGWESGGTRFLLPERGLGRNCIPFVVSRRLVTTYALAHSPIRNPLRSRIATCLQCL